MSLLHIVREPITRSELARLAHEQFGDMVKAVVDVAREVMAIGGELHSDEEAALLDDGSKHEQLWGINLYPDEPGSEWIEYDSLINLGQVRATGHVMWKTHTRESRFGESCTR
ncbi:MAG: DUF5674 family protein [Longimicrobiales bacterium]